MISNVASVQCHESDLNGRLMIACWCTFASLETQLDLSGASLVAELPEICKDCAQVEEFQYSSARTC
jgi:hypothetical protein